MAFSTGTKVKSRTLCGERISYFSPKKTNFDLRHRFVRATAVGFSKSYHREAMTEVYCVHVVRMPCGLSGYVLTQATIFPTSDAPGDSPPRSSSGAPCRLCPAFCCIWL